MLANTKLKKISETVFQEVEELGKERPLEWRRTFNHVYFELSNIEIANYYTVNDTDYFPDVEPGVPEKEQQEFSPSEFPNVAPRPTSRLSVSGVGESEDRIYVASGGKSYKDPDDGIFTVRRPKLSASIRLSSHPNQPNITKQFPNGAYIGGAHWSEDEHDAEDRISIDCHVPKEQLEEIIATLRLHPDTSLSAGVALLSFSYEVDDALRDYWMPRDLIMADSTSALIINVVSKRKEGQQKAGNEDEEADSESLSGTEEESVQSTQPQGLGYSPLLAAALERLSKMGTPLWLIVVLLALHLFK